MSEMCTEICWKCAARTFNHRHKHTRTVVRVRALAINVKRFALLFCCCFAVVVQRAKCLTEYLELLFIFYAWEFVCLVENIVCENYRQRFFGHFPHLDSLFFLLHCSFTAELVFVFCLVNSWPSYCNLYSIGHEQIN